MLEKCASDIIRFTLILVLYTLVTTAIIIIIIIMNKEL